MKEIKKQVLLTKKIISCVTLVLSLAVISIFVYYYSIQNKPVSDIEYKDITGKTNFSNSSYREEYYYSNENKFDVIENFLVKNQHIYYISKDNLSGRKKYKVGDYYFYYDYSFKNEKKELNGDFEYFTSILNDLNINQISGEYIWDDSSKEYNTDKMYIYHVYLAYKSSGEKYGYSLCVDESCVIKDYYFEEYKYGEKIYAEENYINEKWKSKYINR